LSHGLLTGKLHPEREYKPGDLRKANPRFQPDNVARINGLLQQLEPMAKQHRATMGQLVIAWTAAQPGVTCVLCGARDPHQAIENAAAGAIKLSADEIKTIGELVKA
jgi:aryl-alcohol dehydrogenase-like predicted oxidoreductase